MNDKVKFTFKRKLQLWFLEGFPSPTVFIKELDMEFINFQGGKWCLPLLLNTSFFVCCCFLIPGVKTRRANENRHKELKIHFRPQKNPKRPELEHWNLQVNLLRKIVVPAPCRECPPLFASQTVRRTLRCFSLCFQKNPQILLKLDVNPSLEQ